MGKEKRKKRIKRPLLVALAGSVALFAQGCEQMTSGNLVYVPQDMADIPQDMADGAMLDGSAKDGSSK